MPKADFVCAPRLRVRWAEVDMQKIVFNGHYLTYIDTAVAEYWREIGLPGRSPATMKAMPLPEELRTKVTNYERVAPQA
jgi:YbgC/YbaW family acyl-CoA thioester hydrolase